MQLSIVVPCYNEAENIPLILTRFSDVIVRDDVEVVLVDNGSTDESQQYIRENYPDIIFRQSETNLGFGRAHNIGIEYAIEHGYDYVYLLNQDAWIHNDTIEKLQEELSSI